MTKPHGFTHGYTGSYEFVNIGGVMLTAPLRDADKLHNSVFAFRQKIEKKLGRPLTSEEAKSGLSRPKLGPFNKVKLLYDDLLKKKTDQPDAIDRYIESERRKTLTPAEARREHLVRLEKQMRQNAAERKAAEKSQNDPERIAEIKNAKLALASGLYDPDATAEDIEHLNGLIRLAEQGDFEVYKKCKTEFESERQIRYTNAAARKLYESKMEAEQKRMDAINSATPFDLGAEQ